MDTGYLYPPNSHLLNDEIISAHSKRPHAYGNQSSVGVVQGFSKSRKRLKQTQAAVHHHEQKRVNRAIDRSAEDNEYKHRHHQAHVATTKRTFAQPRTITLPIKTGIDYASVAELLVLGKMSLRNRRLVNQRRCRKQENDWLLSLEKDTQQLRAKIDRLKEKCYSLTIGNSSRPNIWNVVIEYFGLFRHGIELRQGATNKQRRFIQHAMAPDVACSSGFGREAMMKSWRWLQFFDDVQVELRVMKNSTENAVDAVTRTHVTITEHTLRNLFPQLLDKNEDTASEFATKLLGRRIVMHGSVHFEWDNARGLVTSVMAESDMLTPLLRPLGSLEDVCLVFDKARVSPDFQWRLQDLYNFAVANLVPFEWVAESEHRDSSYALG
ncbi:unnamed protein product [Phytophthora lilii]|uniref:Unnamed protein product n=1 Tax=Phytophthora lilii TaxID=2077276 RepID=A0A9W6T9J3_9STRA|nr:unnamed protein product [Phytophthora lilii]